MTIDALVKVLRQLAKTSPNGVNSSVCVSAFGGMSCTKKNVTGASLGFDWNHGLVMLHTQPMLTIYEAGDHKRLNDLAGAVMKIAGECVRGDCLPSDNPDDYGSRAGKLHAAHAGALARETARKWAIALRDAVKVAEGL